MLAGEGQAVSDRHQGKADPGIACACLVEGADGFGVFVVAGRIDDGA